MTKLLALQGLRAFAAALVVFVHALDNYHVKALGLQGSRTGLGHGFGELGVQLFFCISGYIIYKSSEHLTPTSRSSIDFIKKRLIRVAPIYWLVTMFYVAKNFAESKPVSIKEAFLSLLFVPYSNDTGLMRPVLGVGWSLNYEMFFYSLVAISIMMPARHRFTFVLAVLFSMLALGHFAYGANTPANTTSFLLLCNQWLVFFMVGLLVAKLSSGRFLQKIPRLSWAAAFYTACGVLCAHMTLLSLATTYLDISSALAPWVCGISVFLATHTQSPKRGPSWIGRILISAGDASYSTYLIHGTLLGLAARTASGLAGGFGSICFGILMIFVCAWIGFLFYKYLERPVTNILAKALLEPTPKA